MRWPPGVHLGGVATFTASLSLEALQKGAESRRAEYRGTEDIYRQQWRWDEVFAATHCVDCYPDNCPYHVYVEDGLPYPTLTRRAQFYIDHEWFLEAGEELPCHKDNPARGGDYPFQMTSGHNRWSIHSMNIVNKVLQETHRGRPHIVLNTDDAERLGIEDEEEVQIYNDMGVFIAPAKLSPSVRPGQVVSYNGWEPYQYRT